MLDFDNIDDWAPKLEAALCPHLPNSVKQRLVKARPEFIEDARDLLLDLTDHDAIVDAVLAWIRSKHIAGYHGSRLTGAEISSIQTVGLIPLDADARRARLVRALSPHPKWHEVKDQLNPAIHSHGKGAFAGRREGQVHLTLSRAGLTHRFNHYLIYGSEFDQHVAHTLLGDEGKDLLARDGKPYVITVAVPGSSALDAAHPFISIDEIRRRGDIPKLVDEFLKSWSYHVAYPSFQSRTLKVDCGMRFNQIVPAAWIKSFGMLTGQPKG
jgi:hypothetical protein